MTMYDKIKLWLDKAMVGGEVSTIATFLDEASTQINHETGEMKIFGYLGGLKVSVLMGGLSVVGSLSKYLHGSNMYTLNKHTTKEALEKLGDSLHIKINDADVTGLEFGTNFLMKHKVQDYLLKLGDMPRLKRYHFDPNTMYYKGAGRQQPKIFTFYDKIEDAKVKGLPHPRDLDDKNILRYEMRLNGRLAHQLQVPTVKAETLYQEPFYRKLMKRYQDSYFSISKLNQIKGNAMDEIKTVTDALNVFIAQLINQTDPNKIGEFINELKDAEVFKDKKNYTRVKNRLHDIASKANLTVSDELIKELDDEIKNCGAYV